MHAPSPCALRLALWDPGRLTLFKTKCHSSQHATSDILKVPPPGCIGWPNIAALTLNCKIIERLITYRRLRNRRLPTTPQKGAKEIQRGIFLSFAAIQAEEIIRLPFFSYPDYDHGCHSMSYYKDFTWKDRDCLHRYSRISCK